MANSRFEYVREFETQCTIMSDCYIVVRIDRQPGRLSINDDDLLKYAAFKVMKAFQEIILTFGGDNKSYSFVLHRRADIYNRRAAKIASCLLSTFTAFYTTQWGTWLPDTAELLTPIFYASTYVLPNHDLVKDYLRSCQSLVGKSSDSLFEQMGVTFLRKSVRLPSDKSRIHILPFYADFYAEDFWQEHPNLLITDRPDEHQLELSILCPLIADEYPDLKYGNDLEFYKLWTLYRRAVVEGNVTLSPRVADAAVDWAEHEVNDVVVNNAWIVVRIDGKGFHKFSAKNNFEKPNDKEALDLMNFAAAKVMSVVKDIVLSFGQSDEYSFVLSRNTSFCHRRASKIESIINSVFTSQYIKYWDKWMCTRTLNGLPTFDARTVPYATDQLLRDYLSWRQADVHINNLYNTCFWKLVCDKHMQNSAAEEYLRVHGTYSDDKRKLLLTMFNIEYDQLPEMYKKGTILMRKVVGNGAPLAVPYHVDMIGDSFWSEHSEILTGDPVRQVDFGDEALPRLCLEQLNDRGFVDAGVVAPSNVGIKGLLCRCAEYELEHSFVPGCWIIIHIRGIGFRDFTQKHGYERPNDDRGLNLMAHVAIAVMNEHTDIALAYLHSDEVVFVHRPNVSLHKHTKRQIEVLFNERFLQLFKCSWSRWFPASEIHSEPAIQTKVVSLATAGEVKELLIKEQHRAHEKNLFNTVLWSLVSPGGRTMDAAMTELANTSTADRNECLFQEFGINYNGMPVRHKKGTILLRKWAQFNAKECSVIVPYFREMNNGNFWKEHDVFSATVPAAVDLTAFNSNDLVNIQIGLPRSL